MEDSDCFSEKNDTNIMSNNSQMANQDNESLCHNSQNSDLKLSDNIVIPNNNQVESENMSSEKSVEAEMEKLCDSIDNELDNNVNTSNAEMCEDLQGILESDEHSATNTNSDFESAAKIAEVSDPEAMEVDEEPLEKNIPEPCPSEESRNEKNVEQGTEPILRNDETQIENNETSVRPLPSSNENIEKEVVTSLTQETEHVNIDLEQSYEKNDGKDTAIESNKNVNDDNPLGDNLDNVMDNNLNKQNEASDQSNVEKNMNIDLNSGGAALATGDLTSSDNKQDEVNKNIADNSSVGAVISLDATQSENQEGADAELCIIPDTHREISQVC